MSRHESAGKSGSKSSLVGLLSLMDQKTKTKMCRLFDHAYTVAKLELPFTKYKTLVAVEKKHGLPLGDTYVNDKACKAFVDEIGETMIEDMQAKWQGEPSERAEPFYFSVLFDGSTDKSISEREVVSIKHIENGKPTMKLLGITAPTKCDAHGIFTALTNKCEYHHLSISHSLVAATADGASVNTGKDTGVFTRLEKAGVPWLIRVHCVAHRLELALHDAFKATYFSEIDDFMMNLYYLFRRSAKKWQEFRNLADMLGTHVVKPSRAHGSRWVDHRRRAAIALDTDYVSLVTHFEDMASDDRKDVPAADKAKLKGYLKRLKSVKFVLCLAFYRDVLEDLAHLSLQLQSDDIPLSAVRANIEATVAILHRKRATPGKHLKGTLNEVTTDVNCKFRGHQLTSRGGTVATTIEAFNKLAENTLINVTSRIDLRFCNFTDDAVFLAADILDPSNYPPAQDKEAILKYGNEHIQVLMNHFQVILLKNGCKMDQIEREWVQFKLYLSRSQPTLQYLDMWQKILNEKQSVFGNFLHLVHILLVVPVASAQVERQFSTIKRILGDWRLTLGQKTIEHLLRICNEGPDPVDFNPEPAVLRWWKSSTRKRRPDVQPSGSRKCPDACGNYTESFDDDVIFVNELDTGSSDLDVMPHLEPENNTLPEDDPLTEDSDTHTDGNSTDNAIA